MLDEKEFLSPYGIRSLSRYHKDHPYVFHVGGPGIPCRYCPAESGQRHVRRQLQLARADLDAGQRPDHSGAAAVLRATTATLHDRVPDRLRPSDDPVRGRRGAVAAARGIFLRDAEGRRPSTAARGKFQEDPHWRDLLLFYEYFHGDNGAGLGASHQTGWMHLFATTSAGDVLEGKRAVVNDGRPSRRRYDHDKGVASATRSRSPPLVLLSLVPVVDVDAAITVRAEQDPEFDFATVRTWAWDQEAGDVIMARTANDDPAP